VRLLSLTRSECREASALPVGGVSDGPVAVEGLLRLDGSAVASAVPINGVGEAVTPVWRETPRPEADHGLEGLATANVVEQSAEQSNSSEKADETDRRCHVWQSYESKLL
jgi:hypothetical protein